MGHPTYHVNVIKLYKMRDYMETRVTSPTWGPPPPCKQALNPLFEVFGSTETFACLRCQKGYKNEKSNQSLFFVVVGTRPYSAKECDRRVAGTTRKISLIHVEVSIKRVDYP